MFNAESQFNSWVLQLMIFIHGLFLQITFNDSTEFFTKLCLLIVSALQLILLKPKWRK